jgi:hypothetical protein
VFGVRLPTYLQAGQEACISVVSYHGDNPPEGVIGAGDFCLTPRAPRVMGARPGCGRWGDTVTLFGWGLYQERFITEPDDVTVKFVEFRGTTPREWTATVGEVREAEVGDVDGDGTEDGDSEIEIEIPFGCPDDSPDCETVDMGPGPGRTEIRVYVEDPPWGGGPGPVELGGRVDFWVNGRENGPFTWMTADFPNGPGTGTGALNLMAAHECFGEGGGVDCQRYAFMVPPFGEVNYTCDAPSGKRATITVTDVWTDPASAYFGQRAYSVDVYDVEDPVTHTRPRLGGISTEYFYISPGGWGGVALSPDCTVLVELS